MPTVRYTSVNGEVLAEKRGGVRRFYVPDPLGSTVALLDSSQTKTDTFTYWPYGEVKDRTGTTPTPLQFVGTQGYYRDKVNRVYVRARHYRPDVGRWLTQDPIGFNGGEGNLYLYVDNRPNNITDYTGLQGPTPYPDLNQIRYGDISPWKCAWCGAAIINKWWFSWQHLCNPIYTHCMACCTLARYVDVDCATGWQSLQNKLQPKSNQLVLGEPIFRRRWRGCGYGIRIPKGTTCHEGCIRKFPWPRNSKNCKDWMGYMNPLKGPLPPVRCCGNVR